MDFGAITTTTVKDLTEREPLILREWVVRYRDSVLAVGVQTAEGRYDEAVGRQGQQQQNLFR